MWNDFKRYMKAHEDDKQAYNNCKSHEEKAKFRLQWAEQTYNKVTITKHRKLQEWEQIDEEKGTHEPIARILHFEGGPNDEEAIIATTNYIKKAFAMKGQWPSWKPMTGRTEILYAHKPTATPPRPWARPGAVRRA